ncbi:beta/gamma crystallin-related protein [Ponticaulis profundi]|uniref:Beta/gamma crystallin-related protein n=1 Tax=Ponticaulis profundi TaxID=2665222 RepID=A0ABW1SAC4_9PROT
MKKSILTKLCLAGLASGLAFAGVANANPYRGGYGQANSGIVLYEHSEFRGQAVNINNGVARLGDYRFNDRASSVRVFSGAWEVCVDGDFRGRCQILDRSTPYLTNLRLNDNISSVRRIDRGYNRYNTRYDNRNGDRYYNDHRNNRGGYDRYQDRRGW